MEASIDTEASFSITVDRGISIAHYRLPLWAVSHREHYETPWGQVWVKGKARVIHRDILDAIWLVADSIKMENNRYVIDFEPGKVLRALGTTKRGTWIEKRLYDLYQLELNYRWNKGEFRLNGLFRYLESIIRLDKKTGRQGQFRGNKYRIVLTELATMMEQKEVRVNLGVFLEKILRLKSNFSRSVARFFITHSRGLHLDFQTLVVAVGADQRNISKWRRELKRDEEALKELGIYLSTKDEKATLKGFGIKDCVIYKNERICHFLKPEPF